MDHTAWIKLRRPLGRGRQRVKGRITAAGRPLERKPHATLIIAASAVEPRPWSNLKPRFLWIEYDWDTLVDGDDGSVSGKPAKHSSLALEDQLINALLSSHQQTILNVRYNTPKLFHHVDFLVRFRGGVVGIDLLALYVDEMNALHRSIPDWAVPMNTSAVERHRYFYTKY